MQKTEISTSPSFSFTCENTLLHFSLSVTSRGKAIIFSLDLDISGLNVGENATASDVELPEGVELALEDDESVLVTITLPRAAIEEEEGIEGLEGEELEEGEEGAEGESSEETVEEESSDEAGE